MSSPAFDFSHNRQPVSTSRTYGSPRLPQTAMRYLPSPSHSPRSLFAPCQLAEAFSPVTSAYPSNRQYHSPSNPFCRRRLFTSHSSPARRLDYGHSQPSLLLTELRWLKTQLVWVVETAISRCEYDALVRVLFWAAFIVFLSHICGPGRSPVAGESVGMRLDSDAVSSRTWRVGEYHDYLEGIWETDRRFM
jgi:hypothetical protein